MKPNPNHRVLYWILALAVVMFGIVVYNAINTSSELNTQKLSPNEENQARKVEIIQSLSESGTSSKEKASIIKFLVDAKVSQKTKADIIGSLRVR